MKGRTKGENEGERKGKGRKSVTLVRLTKGGVEMRQREREDEKSVGARVNMRTLAFQQFLLTSVSPHPEAHRVHFNNALLMFKLLVSHQASGLDAMAQWIFFLFFFLSWSQHALLTQLGGDNDTGFGAR